MKKIQQSLAVVFLFCLTGCATIVSRSNWPVTVNSNPSEAKVTIYNSSGIPLVTGVTPFRTILASGDGYFTPAKYRVELTKPGCQTTTMMISASFNPWYAGNLIFGGLLGLLIVDPATGAMWRLDEFYITSLPKGVASLHKPGTVTVIALKDVPMHLRSKMVRVNQTNAL